jgi:hypothetical protein
MYAFIPFRNNALLIEVSHIKVLQAIVIPVVNLPFFSNSFELSDG